MCILFLFFSRAHVTKIEQSGLLAFGLLVCIKSLDSVTFFCARCIIVVFDFEVKKTEINVCIRHICSK